MGTPTNTAEMLESWLGDNSERLGKRFTAVRVNDWTLWEKHGIALDLEGADAWGRVTAWAKHLADAEWPFADVEAIDAHTDRQLLWWGFQPLSMDLLDRWLRALESHSTSS